jgi:hypothetical protein
MAFKYEVVELANGIIETLHENKFFEETPFVGETELLQKLKENMQRKWETNGEMLLTDNEFIETCNEVMHESLTDTLGTLLDKEAIEMSIGADGEIYYSANPDFDIDNLLN